MLSYRFLVPFSTPAMRTESAGQSVCESYLTCSDSASSIRFFSCFSMARNLSETSFPSSFSSDARRSHLGSDSTWLLLRDRGRFTGIRPTPSMRSMFCRMLEKNGIAADSVLGMGQPPITGAIADVAWFPLEVASCSTNDGNSLEKSLNPPDTMYGAPFQPAVSNFFSMLSQLDAPLRGDELAS